MAVISGKRVSFHKSTLLCLLLLATPALSWDISFMRWKGADTGVIIAVAISFGTVIGLMISFYLGSRSKDNRVAENYSAKLFKEGCTRCRLTADEAAALRALAAYTPGAETKAHLIFETQALFERCVEAYVNFLYRTPRGEDKDETLRCLRYKLGFSALASEIPLMSSRNLSAGQPVSLFTAGGNTPIGNAVVSRVGEFSFALRAAGDPDTVQSLPAMTIALLRHGDAAYSFTARVKAAEGAEITLFHTLEFLRNQNRRYMRLDVNLPIKYRVVGKTVAMSVDKSAPDEMLQARSVDIGGGGISFIADWAHSAGDMIQLSMTMAGQTVSGILSKILRVVPVNADTQTRYKHLVQFVGIEPPQREHIVKFIFEKQREMLQMR